MKLIIDSQSTSPIYVQIIDQVKCHIAGGELVPGTKLPTVRKLAEEIGAHVNTVARAYAELERGGVVVTRPGLGTFVAQHAEDRRLMAERKDRLDGIVGRSLVEALSLGYSLDQIEAAFALRLARWSHIDDASETPIMANLPPDVIIAVGSHDLTLDLLAAELRRHLPPRNMTSAHVGSLGGLMALAQGEAHVAGCHLLDEETGEYNLPYLKRLLPGQETVLVNLAYRVQGLIVAQGNPLGLQGIRDLARPGVVFVNRQRGSGTRVLLDHELRQANIAGESITGYERETTTHLAVAAAVASGTADAGLGILAVARALELDFVPLWRERYDLAMLRSQYEGALLQPMLEVIGSARFRRVVEEMGGYDTAQTGQVVGGA